MTSPVRQLFQSFKVFLSKHRKLLETAIFAKGFLRGGIKSGKARVENYRNLVDKKQNCVTLEISRKLRKEQSSYKFSKNVKFSILVPLYNTPIDYLEQMIESVRKQTYSNWELCLADGSDNAHNYVEEYCLKMSKCDKRIKYKRLTENRGISENTNECIKMASGNYIALFDHDDILDLTYCMSICMQFAIKTPILYIVMKINLMNLAASYTMQITSLILLLIICGQITIFVILRFSKKNCSISAELSEKSSTVRRITI